MVIIQGISADGDVLVKGPLTYKYHVSRGRTAYSDDELSITVSWWFGHMVFLDFSFLKILCSIVPCCRPSARDTFIAHVNVRIHMT